MNITPRTNPRLSGLFGLVYTDDLRDCICILETKITNRLNAIEARINVLENQINNEMDTIKHDFTDCMQIHEQNMHSTDMVLTKEIDRMQIENNETRRNLKTMTQAIDRLHFVIYSLIDMLDKSQTIG